MLYALKSARSARPRTLGLTVPWESRGAAFRESLHAFLSGPKLRKNGFGNIYFRDAYVRPYWPNRAVAASTLCHVALISLLSLPIWKFLRMTPQHAPVQIEVTWNTPARDLPPLTFPGSPARPSPPGEPNRPLPRRGANAFHPRQTILSMPQRPSHPRQTLIQPGALPEPPKFSPQLPNIMEWTPVRSSRPRLRLNLSALAPLRRRASPHQGTPPAPDLQNLERTPGQLNIASSAVLNPAPRMPMNPSATPRFPIQPRLDVIDAPDIGVATGDPRSNQIVLDKSAPNVRMPVASNATPRAGHPRGSDVGPAPDISGPVNADIGTRRVIALSATPGPPAPDIGVPPGNLSSRTSISPEGTRPGVPGGSPAGTPGATGGAGGGPGSQGGTGGAGGTKPGPGGGGQNATGPGSVSVTGGNPNSTTAGTGGGASTSSGGTSPSTKASSVAAEPQPRPEPVNPMRTQPTLGMDRIEPGATPEQILGAKRIYTVYVNMPNLTSATGSWVLNFAELNSIDNPARDTGDLSSPVPVRKVDPKYPPTLMNEHVEGEVVLYAIIRRDGSVDSIQLLKGIDPQLDQNAMEAFSRWKFRPGTRNGAPVELETVVHIPFRLASP
jgi:TonB family protein